MVLDGRRLPLAPDVPRDIDRVPIDAQDLPTSNVEKLKTSFEFCSTCDSDHMNSKGP